MFNHFSTQAGLKPLNDSARRFIVSCLALGCCFCALSAHAHAQRNRTTAMGGTGRAVVVDERLAALRDEPQLGGHLVQRLGRGRMVSIIGASRASDGVNFYRVAVTRRTRGWLQAESLVSPTHAGDDAALLRLIRGSEEFDRISRAQIFLDTFPRSPLRPTVLLLFGEEAEQAATKLTREAERRLDAREMTAGGAPLHSYYLNFNGLDRYRKQGIGFVFDRAAKRFHYDGASWREILRRYPRSPEAVAARAHLARFTVAGTQ